MAQRPEHQVSITNGGEFIAQSTYHGSGIFVSTIGPGDKRSMVLLDRDEALEAMAALAQAIADMDESTTLWLAERAERAERA